MKKYFLITLIIAFTAQINAQSNLIFNQVINESLPIGVQLTVPVGKVWKITMMNNNVKINGVETLWNVHKITTPVWLGEGNIIEGLTNPNPMLSIIEFNVVPTSTTTGGSGGGVSADGFTASGIINLEFSGTNSSGNIGTKIVLGTITVPEGKIWKIISSSFGNSSNPDTVYLGNGYNGDIFVDDFIVSGEDRPVYLTAGSYEVAGKTAASGGGGTYYILGKIGGIEYNDN